MNIIPDVSHHNPIKNWDILNTNLLISKATEGTTYVDPTLDRFIQGCESHRICYWLYAYLRKGAELDQTKFLIDTCKSKIGDYFRGYILDIEAGNSASDCKAAMNYLSEQGGKFMIYTGHSDYDKYKSVIQNRPKKCAWWEARYGKNDGTYSDKYACHKGVDLHQFTSAGSFPGLAKARTDLSRLTGNKSLNWFTDPDNKITSKGRVGTVTDELYARKGPGTGYAVIGSFRAGSVVEILDTVINSNGKPWHKVTVNGKTGYISGKYVLQ